MRDRLSWIRFLGLGLGDPVPDANTIWTFEALTKAGAIEPLFALFDQALRAAGYLAMSGELVDATIVSAPKQRNTKAEKQALREGRIPDGWAEKPAKLRQKERDARWTVKYNKAGPDPDGEVPPVDIAIPAFGYQNHVGADRRHRLIRRWTVTDAGARLGEILDPSNTAAEGLGGYRLPQQEERGIARGPDAREPYPPEKATWPAPAGPYRPCQPQALGDPGADRAHLRLPEGQDRPLHPLDRPCPR